MNIITKDSEEQTIREKLDEDIHFRLTGIDMFLAVCEQKGITQLPDRNEFKTMLQAVTLTYLREHDELEESMFGTVHSILFKQWRSDQQAIEVAMEEALDWAEETWKQNILRRQQAA